MRKITDGRVQINGALGIMEINGILSQMVFENNRDKHEFYLEEAYVIPWMYPYLTPHGFIMKLNPQPVDITEEVTNQGMAFWLNQVHRLTISTNFLDNRPARRSFSKLRASSAGLYAARGMLPQAERAFRQALALYPFSPESNFRFAQEVFVRQRRFQEARDLMEKYKGTDDLEARYSLKQIDAFLAELTKLESTSTRMQALEAQFTTGKMDLNDGLELAGLYLQMQMMDRFTVVADTVMNRAGLPAPAYMRLALLFETAKDKIKMSKSLDLCLESSAEDPPPDALLTMARLYASVPGYDKMVVVMQKYLAMKPDDWKAWLDLAAVCVNLKDNAGAIDALREAAKAGGADATNVINNDHRFSEIRTNLDK